MNEEIDLTKLSKKELEEYYTKKLNKLFKKIVKNPFKSVENLKKITDLLDEMKDKEIITKTQYEKHMNKIYSNLNAPQEFKEWLEKKKEWIVKLIKKKQRKV